MSDFIKFYYFWIRYYFGSGTDSVSLLILLFLLFFLLLGDDIQKSPRLRVSNRIGVKFGKIVLQVNMHRLTKSDFRFDVTLSSFKMAAMMSFHAKKTAAVRWVHTRRLPGAYATASVRCSLALLSQFLIHSAFVLVLLDKALMTMI